MSQKLQHDLSIISSKYYITTNTR